MKLYTFVNSYIFGIQVGIQASHSVTGFIMENRNHPKVIEWYEDSETYAWLDGGDNNAMWETVELCENLGELHTIFNEEGLAHALTAFTILPSEKLLETMELVEKKYDFSEYDDYYKLATRLVWAKGKRI